MGSSRRFTLFVLTLLATALSLSDPSEKPHQQIPDLQEYKHQVLARLVDEALSGDADVILENELEVLESSDTVTPQRINFASGLAGATIAASNPEMTGAKGLLLPDADAYALSRCDAKKFVVIQLPEDVAIDEVLLTNEERYSSAVHQFRLTGSLKYPTTEWVVLGNFSAANVLGEQRFIISSKAFVRYLKMTWLSHFGTEFYCTLSRVQVR
jgi:hypothetical protein